MISIQSLKNQLNDFAQSLEVSHESSTLSRLYFLSKNEGLSSYANEEMDFFSKKYDISLKLFAAYDDKGRKLSNEVVDQTGLQLLAGLFFLRILLAVEQAASGIQQAKYINVCLKVFERIELPAFLQSAPAQLKELQNQLFERLPIGDLNDLAQSSCDLENIKPAQKDGFTVLPINVLFYEGPIARAYLETLYSLRCKPRRIIHLIAERDLVTKKVVGQFLPSFIRQKYAANVQLRKIHHWPQHLFRTQKKLCLEVFEHLQEALNIKQENLLGLVDLKPLDHYSDEVLPIFFSSLKDAKLIDFIKKQGPSTYLFTGGGIVPRSFFELENTRFLHIHPGHLPEIRGADCLLWSAMLSGYPSATCFYMDPGIDTGDVINAAFLPKITLPDTASQLDDKMAYRLLYSFIDPWVRSVVLRDTLCSTNYLENITALPQSIEAGTTFHFMDQSMKNAVIKKVFMESALEMENC